MNNITAYLTTAITKGITLSKKYATMLRARFMALSRVQQAGAIIGVIVLGFILASLGGSAAVEENVTQKARKVVFSRVDELGNVDGSLSLVGVVTSTSEAEIRAESSGRLTRVYKKLGDRVYAGEIIAQFENSAERAALLQAEGAYEAAKAAREIAGINSQTTSTTINDTKAAALNTTRNAYVTMDDLIRAKTDSVYTNPRTAFPVITMLTSNSQVVITLQNERPVIERILTEREARNAQLGNDSDLVAELTAVQKEAEKVQAYLDVLGALYASAIPNGQFPQSTIDGQKAVVSAARSAIAGTVSSLVATRSTLISGLAAQTISGNAVGVTSPTTASSDASVKSALGAYNAALSRLSKTTVRSPISGTLNSLSIQTGDYVNQATPVAVVANNGSLEVLAYISEDDARRVSPGTVVTVGAQHQGIVTRVASGIDPVTKKIEVRIGLREATSEYINGQSVRVQVSTAPKQKKQQGPLLIPLSAIKITPQGSFVFTPAASSTVQAVAITTGAILGEEIEVESGLSADMVIARDARGLKEGMEVDGQ